MSYKLTLSLLLLHVHNLERKLKVLRTPRHQIWIHMLHDPIALPLCISKGAAHKDAHNTGIGTIMVGELACQGIRTHQSVRNKREKRGETR